MENLIPKLRFPEFKDEWEDKQLGEILTIGSGKDYKHLNYGDVPVYGTGGYMTSVDNFLYDGETVCIGRKGTIDSPKFYSGKIWTVDTLFYTHTFKNITPRFVYNLFLRINWKEYNEASGVPSLSKSTIEKIGITHPSLPEQQKIATFLTASDEKLQALKKKKSLLEQYKKGVMQGIFSSGRMSESGFSELKDEQDFDDNNPSILKSSKSRFRQLRFKDENGNDFPEWEEKSLGEVGKFYAGGDLSKLNFKKEKDDEFKYPIYANGAGEGLYGYANTFQYPPNCVTVSGRGNLGYANVRKENFNAIVRLIVINPINDVNSKFLEESINNLNFAIESTGVPQLTVPQISTYNILLPSLQEQTAIANFLTSIDDKINHCGEQIAKMKVWKKGLLQGMFC